MRFVVFVEGYLEKIALPPFLRNWLNSATTRPVGVNVIRFQGGGEFKNKLASAVRRHLNGPSNFDLIAVVGILDLYGVNYYPNHVSTVRQRYDWLCQHFENEVDSSKFHMFCAVHEFEAWILSQPENLPSDVREALPGRVQNPESVNFHNPPSKLLQRLYRQRLKRDYKKIVDGSSLFSRLDPAVARDKCPYLKRMMDKLLSLAQEAGC